MPELPADRWLWLTEDRATVVEEGDPRANSLLAAPGAMIEAGEVERLGLTLERGKIVSSGQWSVDSDQPDHRPLSTGHILAEQVVVEEDTEPGEAEEPDDNELPETPHDGEPEKREKAPLAHPPPRRGPGRARKT